MGHPRSFSQTFQVEGFHKQFFQGLQRAVVHQRPPHGECAGRHRRVVGYVSAIGASLTRALWSGALRCTSTEASRSMKLRLRDGEVNTTKVLERRLCFVLD